MNVFLLVTLWAGLVAAGFAAGWFVGHRRVPHLHKEIEAAHLDPLTGLPDRSVIDEVLREAADKHRVISVAVCDVNDMHGINERLGHIAGDQMLQAIAHRLINLLPLGPGGIVCRVGEGDEYWIVSPVEPKELSDAYTSNVNGLAYSAAVGIASSPRDGSPQRAALCADIAMYASKQQHVPVTLYDLTLGTPEGVGDELPSMIRNRRKGDPKFEET